MTSRVCRHTFNRERKPCTQVVPEGADTCLWHNPRVDKRAAYVVDLLKQALSASDGDAEGFHLVGLVWPRARLAGVRLLGADLRDAVLPAADLAAVDLTGCCLRRANLAGANLSGARLVGCDLTHAHLANANLRGADLRGARLDGAVLLATDLREADCTDARMQGFRWNRLTRFSGARGFESEGAGDETRQFPAPLAIELEEGAKDPATFGDWNEDLERTRDFEFIAPATAPGIDALRTTGTALDGPSPSSPGTNRAAAMLRQRLRILSLTLAMALGLGLTGWAAALFLVFNPLPRGIDSSPPGLPVASELPREQAPTPRLDDPRLAVYRATIADLQQETEALREERARLALSLRDRENTNSSLRLDLQRLRSVNDDNLTLRLALDEAEATLAALRADSGRLEDTARILADGVDDLERENQRLAQAAGERFTELEQATRLQAENQRLSAELAQLQVRFDRVESERNDLHTHLTQAQDDLERFLTRIEGTRLEDLLSGDDERGPLLAIEPGRAIALGGRGVLITARVEAGETAGEVVLRLVVQRADRAPLPDLGLVLYGANEQALRRFSYSFPDATVRPSLGRFASVRTVFTSDRFPTALRVRAAAGQLD